MSSCESNSLGQVMIDHYIERQQAARAAVVTRELEIDRLLPRLHPMDALVEVVDEFGLATVADAEVVPIEKLGTIAKRILSAHFAIANHEALLERHRAAMIHAQSIENLFQLFVAEQVGKTVIISQSEQRAEPSLGVFIPQFNGNHTFETTFTGTDGSELVPYYLKGRKPNYRLSEAIGFVHAATATVHHNAIILTTTPEDTMTSETGFIVAAVLDNSDNPRLAISFE